MNLTYPTRWRPPARSVLTAAAVAAAGLAAWTHLHTAQLRRQLTHAHHAATHDTLTGLPNRAGLAEQWPRWAPTRPTVALLDLDEFKPVNDHHGHAAGDHLLTVVAHRLDRSITGGVVARLGGDEFAAILNTHNPVTLFRTAAATLERPVQLDSGATVAVTASIGLTRSADGDLAAALARADAAMYRAKTLHLGVAVYDPNRDDRPDPAHHPRPNIRVRDRHQQRHTPGRSRRRHIEAVRL